MFLILKKSKERKSGFTAMRKFLLKMQTPNISRKLQEAVFVTKKIPKTKKTKQNKQTNREEYLHFYNANPKNSALPAAYRSFLMTVRQRANEYWKR